MRYCVFSLCLLFNDGVYAQQPPVHFDYKKIYSRCLDGDVAAAFLLVDSAAQLSDSDRNFKMRFEVRFRGDHDRSDLRRSDIDPLLKIFRDYWRNGLLHPEGNFDSALVDRVAGFLGVANDGDTIDKYEKQYVERLGLHTTGFGKTGKLFDLLVWKTEKDTTYSFVLGGDKTSSRVIFMDDFVTLGWEEYATLGKYYPGGWATKKALYCVRSGYDLQSEDFLVSYLAHESRHFADYKKFPGLRSADLEYRAKLTELSLARKTLYELIGFFIANANKDSENGHSAADYRVIADLSLRLWKKAFVTDMQEWKKQSVSTINKAAMKVLQKNSPVTQKHNGAVHK